MYAATELRAAETVAGLVLAVEEAEYTALEVPRQGALQSSSVQAQALALACSGPV